MTEQSSANAPGGPVPLRLFFALWPGSGQRARIHRHQALWKWDAPARPTPEPKLHLTLLFMEGVAAHRVAELLEVGAAVSRQWVDFDLTLDRAAVWRHGGIAHLAPSQPPPGLLALHAALAAQVAQRGLPFDARPYAPHVTLGRRTEKLTPPGAFAPLHWTVSGFVLAQSVLGTGRYDVLGRWPAKVSGQ